MAISLQETDTTAPDGAIAACSSLGAATTTDNRTATKGGTAGSTAHSVTVQINTTGRRAVHFEMAAGELDAYPSIPAGNWTVRLNVSTAAGATVTWDFLYICRVNSSGVSQKTIASSSAAGGGDCSIAGVKTVTLSGSADTPALGDKGLASELVGTPGGDSVFRPRVYTDGLRGVDPTSTGIGQFDQWWRPASEPIRAPLRQPTLLHGLQARRRPRGLVDGDCRRRSPRREGLGLAPGTSAGGRMPAHQCRRCIGSHSPRSGDVAQASHPAGNQTTASGRYHQGDAYRRARPRACSDDGSPDHGIDSRTRARAGSTWIKHATWRRAPGSETVSHRLDARQNPAAPLQRPRRLDGWQVEPPKLLDGPRLGRVAEEPLDRVGLGELAGPVCQVLVGSPGC
jgi:hypothetical protein